MSRSAQEIQDRIVAQVSGLTGLTPAEIDLREPYRRFGLDSVALVTIVADLETWLGHRFRDNPLEEHPTIESLARYLAEQSQMSG